MSAATGCTGPQYLGDNKRYSEQDIVVVGRLKNLHYQWSGDADDLLGHSWITARLHISRVIKGGTMPNMIKVTYFAHTEMREDVQLRLRLRYKGNGKYVICAANGGVGITCSP